ncbi:ribosomal L10 family protein [Orientia chuto str. Dubai]|uniref:Large ribosomal subunit protein uL10 n=1 Tax=Orientia chuto str. Dubai TaxID=1359168 RepID=A0A0F3MP14_9RICK|nr:50S ribosomal protein L10 [Candidatus Orientia mediorientalis]KJV57485.1 ribosomal L10 family protein [Orientia chuto str. Dubai]
MLYSKKKEAVKFLEELYKNVNIIVVLHYHGLTVAQLTQIRKDLRVTGAKLKIIKNTLAKIAVKNLNIKQVDMFSGPVAIAYSKEYITVPKVIFKFTNQYPNLKIIGGFVDQKVATIDNIKQLASFATSESHKINFVNLLQLPIRRFVVVSQSSLVKLVTVLKNYVNKS